MSRCRARKDGAAGSGARCRCGRRGAVCVCSAALQLLHAWRHGRTLSFCALATLVSLPYKVSAVKGKEKKIFLIFEKGSKPQADLRNHKNFWQISGQASSSHSQYKICFQNTCTNLRYLLSQSTCFEMWKHMFSKFLCRSNFNSCARGHARPVLEKTSCGKNRYARRFWIRIRVRRSFSNSHSEIRIRIQTN